MSKMRAASDPTASRTSPSGRLDSPTSSSTIKPSSHDPSAPTISPKTLGSQPDLSHKPSTHRATNSSALSDTGSDDSFDFDIRHAARLLRQSQQARGMPASPRSPASTSTYFVGSSSLRARRTSLQAEATSLEARANDLSSLLTAKRAKAQLEKQLDRARMREELVTDELWRTRRGRARDRLEILEKEIREADRRQSADRRSAGDWLGNSIMRDHDDFARLKRDLALDPPRPFQSLYGSSFGNPSSSFGDMLSSSNSYSTRRWSQSDTGSDYGDVSPHRFRSFSMYEPMTPVFPSASSYGLPSASTFSHHAGTYEEPMYRVAHFLG
ncbi:hypothetical protein EMMF5_001380 [Cystobasidiomycetes sp. EMM_F5]